MYALGNVYRLMGRKQDAARLFTQLLDVVIETQTTKSDTAVSLSKTLCDLYNEVCVHDALTKCMHQTGIHKTFEISSGSVDGRLPESVRVRKGCTGQHAGEGKSLTPSSSPSLLYLAPSLILLSPSSVDSTLLWGPTLSSWSCA